MIENILIFLVVFCEVIQDAFLHEYMSHMIVPGDDDSWKCFAESVTCAGGTTSTDAIVI